MSPLAVAPAKETIAIRVLGRFVFGIIVLLVIAENSLAATFTNPLGAGSDPWVVFFDGYYYYSGSDGGNKVVITKAEKLQDISSASKITVWTAPEDTVYSRQLWAPELHYLRGKWYIYVAADDGVNANHRMYVLEGSTQNPQDPFVLKGKISAPTDRWAIDGTVFSFNDDELYLVWSGWDDVRNVAQNLYIASMSDPWTISSERVLIAAPTYSWEKRVGEGGPLINEGPTVLKRGTELFIIYSASGSWTDDYCLGQLRYQGGSFLNKASWEKKATPVFSKTEFVFGPGHASFVTSPDGTQDWIVYHAAKYSGSGWNRNIRIQPFTWHSDGSPNFGVPVNEGVPLEEPAT